MRLDVVILPPDNINGKVGELAKKLDQKYDLIFKVDNKKLFPHVTLFHLDTKKTNLAKIRKQIEKISKRWKGFELVYAKPGYSDSGYFNFELQKSRDIYRLHQAVVGSLYKYSDKKRHKGLSGLENKYYAKYGSRRILKLYQPHITIGRHSGNNGRVVKDIKAEFSSFVADNIALAEIDNQAQVVRIFNRYKLAPNIDLAIKILKRGGVVVYPTETSYGLAVDATNRQAVKKLYRLKGRNFKKPIHVIYPSAKWLSQIVKLNVSALRLMVQFIPGPLTIVLPLKSKLPSFKKLSAGTDTLGVRLPRHKLAMDLVKKFGKPITTTSANLSGQPACYSAEDARRQFTGSGVQPDYYLDGGPSGPKSPSTVISLINGVRILRNGPITERQIKQALK
jgi:L-threonylcarbamoyladenylate synthase